MRSKRTYSFGADLRDKKNHLMDSLAYALGVDRLYLNDHLRHIMAAEINATFEAAGADQSGRHRTPTDLLLKKEIVVDWEQTPDPQKSIALLTP